MRTARGALSRRLLAAGALLVGVGLLLAGSGPSGSRDRLSGIPRTVLWAWERREQLTFIHPGEIGVAFLARTLVLRGDEVLVRPRLQPLGVADGTALIAVTRIEASRRQPPALTPAQRALAASRIAELADTRGVTAVQVDFDATASQRGFYRGLLHDLRRRLPAPVALSITALASWCLHDGWLEGLPVDEAVPMLFRMGVDDRPVRHYLDSGGDFRAPVCRRSVGVSTDEAPPRLPPGRRVYVFHPRPWSQEVAEAVVSATRRPP